MRIIFNDTQRTALVPQYVGELIAQGSTLYISSGLTAGAWNSISVEGLSSAEVQALIDAAADDYAKVADLVTTISDESTDNEIPTAAAVYALFTS